jgi:hypothetical protein
MNKLNLFFDARQFEIAFGAATVESSAAFEKSQPGARLKAGVAAAATDLSRDVSAASEVSQAVRLHLGS